MYINPIIILGNPRSGTTLLRVILNAHDELLITPEFGFAIWLYSDFNKKNFKKKSVLNKFLEELKAARKFETWKIDIQELKKYLVDKMQIGDYIEIIDLVYKFYGYSKSIKFNRWGDKNNFYIYHIDELIKMFPNGQFIHIVRDGRDVACSYIALAKMNINSKYKPILPTDVEKIAHEWCYNNKLIEDKLKKISNKKKITIRYEDLIINFEKSINKIINFLDLTKDEKVFNYYKSNSFEPKEFMQWKKKISKKPDSSNIGRFKNYLTKSEIQSFNLIANEMLSFYNYK